LNLPRRLAGAGALALLVLAFNAAPAAAAPARTVRDRWSAPFHLAGPTSLDLLPSTLAFAPSSGATVGFATQDEDNPADSEAFTVTRSAAGRVGRVQPVAGSQQILDLAYDGTTLKLLAASAGNGGACCSTAQVVSVDARGRRSARAVTSALSGATVGRLLVLPRHVIVAVLAAANGVWVERAPVRGGHAPGPAHQLLSGVPTTLAAADLSGGRSVVAWTSSPRPALEPPRTIMTAFGSATTAPRSPRVAWSVSAGHEIDELQLSGGSPMGTAAWVESWFDRAGAFHSEVVVADLEPPVRPKPFPVSGRFASGVSLASDDRGDQTVTWEACDPLADCRVEAVSRRAGARFGAVRALGAIDASQAPVAAVAPDGEAVVGWISNGHVFAAEQPRAGAGFAPVHKVSGTSYASDLTLGFAPDGTALAAWTEGSVASSVVGAVLR
jgi:hypothetical protein